MVNKLILLLKTGLIGLVTLLFGYLVAAVVLSFIKTNPEELSCPKQYQVYIATNGVHLDLIIPRHALPEHLKAELGLPDWAEYLAFGWGDKDFYINTPTWDDLKLVTAFRALFLETASAMHVVWLHRSSPRWKKITLCDVQLLQLNNFVDATFRRHEQGGLINIEAAGYTDTDMFYEAYGNFSCIQTCNNWVNRALKAAQVPTSIWSPFDRGVLYHQSSK